MSVVMANALGTGIFCGLWQGIGSVLGLATWMGFVGCTSYFSAGCGKTVLLNPCAVTMLVFPGVCVLSCQEISTVAFCLVRS